MNLLGLAVVLGIVFLVLAALGVVGWVPALLVAVAAILVALILFSGAMRGWRL